MEAATSIAAQPPIFMNLLRMAAPAQEPFNFSTFQLFNLSTFSTVYLTTSMKGPSNGRSVPPPARR